MTLEAVVWMCFVKKVFLEISQKSQENTCARESFLIKLQAWPATLLKKSLWHRCFPVNFAKFPRTPSFTERLQRLLLLLLWRWIRTINNCNKEIFCHNLWTNQFFFDFWKIYSLCLNMTLHREGLKKS